jgi:uncharacterized ion transporter superfamily protein YfcC
MIPLRYSHVRWVIVAIGVAIAVSLYYFFFPVGVTVFLVFLLILTAMSWIVPPGIYGWLVHAVCPTCGKTVEWEAVQPDGAPYHEQIVIHCPGCDKSKVEWQYTPA